MVGILTMKEAVFGPLWAWIFANEQVPLFTITGRVIIFFALLLQFYYLLFLNKKKLLTKLYAWLIDCSFKRKITFIK